MTSTIVPPVDLVPGVPSRVVTVSTVDLPEGTPVDATFTFALSSHLDARADGKIITDGAKTITLSGGEGRIRLPVYSPAVKTPWGTGGWSVVVTSSIGYCKNIRVPAGSSTISLAEIPEARPLTWEEQQWALTGAGITVVQGSSWDASVELVDGVLRFVLTVPASGDGASFDLTGVYLTSNDTLDSIAPGWHFVHSATIATALGLPRTNLGWLRVIGGRSGTREAEFRTVDYGDGTQRRYTIATNHAGSWASSRWVQQDSRYRGNLDEQTGTLSDLQDGWYLVRYVATAEAWGLPQRLIGILDVTRDGDSSQRTIVFKPNDAGAGFGAKAFWEVATDSNGNLRDRWQRSDKHIMRSAPMVLTAPAGEYPQANSRGAVRIPFRVPTNVSKVRVHMRPWNFRTGKQWGPARLDGVMIAQQGSGGTITGSRWYAPNVDGKTVTGAEEWVSDWFYVGLIPNQTFLLCYGAEWLDDVRDLVIGECWSNFDLSKWDSTEDAIYSNGWGGFGLQPMDIWIECEAPSNVPIYGYVGPSNMAGVDAGGPFYAYPTLHALRNGAFCALTAAGGWSIMDSSMHNSAIINRFGYPARMVDRIYLELGANIEARDATAAEAMVEMERWMNQRLGTLGSPPVHLITQVSRWTSEGTTDTAGTFSDWNEWIRWTAATRPEVVGLFDQAAIFADPDKPWTARKELRVSDGNVHFNAFGQKLRAAAMDGEIHLPIMTARNPSEIPANTGLLTAYLAARGA